jgi:hypothetical protein
MTVLASLFEKFYFGLFLTFAVDLLNESVVGVGFVRYL